MKKKLDKAWKAYCSRQRLAEWREMNDKRVGYYTYYPKSQPRSNSREKFNVYARKILCNQGVSIEWQEDGGVIVAGVIAFSLT